ncbi:MAG: HlyD family secretion protein [Paludibacteraceae bacterium]|nr:HlyD family secretion protein [Paludibacteraceae bacterium]
MEKKQINRYIYNIVVVILLLIGIAIVICQFTHFGNIEYTDNARVRQHISPQNTRVQGFIREIRFEEFMQVHKGDTLVIIEDAEYRLRLAQAIADLQRAEQDSKATGSSIITTNAGISVTEASIDEARINMENAKREDDRYASLLKESSVTQQQYDNIHTAYLAAKSRYDQVQRSRTAKKMFKTEQGHRLSAANASLQLASAAVDLARLNLSYCYIVASCDGVIGTKDINVGQLVNPGQTLVNIVDDKELWVEANFRERQLPYISIGAPVKMKVDAVPDEEYTGVVERISDATGSAFSLLPIDNATGNFVKVEQRVTVRIKIDNTDADKTGKLRAGYSVECEVESKSDKTFADSKTKTNK